MKKFLFFIFLLAFLYLAIVLIPLGISFYSLYSLAIADDLIPLEFDGFSIEEAGAESELETPPIQPLTLTIHEADLSAMLTDMLSEREYACVKLSLAETAISPEMMSLTLSWQCEILGYQLYEFRVFSEWLIRLREDAQINRIDVKPQSIHPTQRYNIFNWTLNWARVWPYATQTRDVDGWLPVFSSSSRLNIHDLLLKDQECSVFLSF